MSNLIFIELTFSSILYPSTAIYKIVLDNFIAIINKFSEAVLSNPIKWREKSSNPN